MDIQPGDRQELCHGLMEPTAIEAESGGYNVLHRCVICRAVRKNRVASEDNFNVVLELSKNAISI